MQKLDIAELEMYMVQGFVPVDFRGAEAFVAEHIPGSVFVNEELIRDGIVALMIPKEFPLVIIAEPGQEESAGKWLQQGGYDNILGYLNGGFNAWLSGGKRIDVVISIDAEEMMLDMKFDDPNIVDIRSKAAFKLQHVENADNVDIKKILERIGELPSDKIYYLYDENGEKALAVISWLKRNGLYNYYHITGGFRAMDQAEAPMQSSTPPAPKPGPDQQN